MTINFCEVCLTVIICTIITIVFYLASWYNHEVDKSKKADTSNMQGLDNDEPIARGEPNETVSFNSNIQRLASSGEIVKEKSDLCRLQDEDLRSRVAENESGEPHTPDDYVKIESDDSDIPEFDPVVHPDTKPGRLQLSIRYDNERSRLIVKILAGEGLIRPEQTYAPEMCLTFTLIGPYLNDEDTEKHTRVVVDNSSVIWKEPMRFCSTFKNAIKQNLYVNVSNKTDPNAPRDREISIPLDTLKSENEEINQWFDLQFVQSSY